MSVEFKLPELGENVEKGDVVRVLVSVGDVIKADQSVLELETDKATIEVPASEGGTVSEVRVKPGDKVKVGQVVLVFDAAPAKARVAASGPVAAPAAPARVAAPAAASKPAPKPASVVAIASARPAPSPVEVPAPSAVGAAVAAAPSVRRYARELGVEIGDVAGTGPAGRIGQDDVTRHVKGAMAGGPSTSLGAGRAPALPDFSKWGEIESRPMSNIRRTTAEHLTAAWQAPHVTQHDKADVTALEEFRKAYGSRVEAGGGKLTVTAILIKIVATAIGRFPQFASSVDMANEAIIYKKYIHIGVAVDTPEGLLVPVIRDADKKGIAEIVGRAGGVVPEGARQEAHPRRDVGRRILHHQSGRHRRHRVHADRQPAGGRDPRRVSHGARAGVEATGRSCRARCCRCRFPTTTG